MLPLWIFLLLAATIILPCNSTPDDVDDFRRLSASLSMQSNDLKTKNEKHNRDIEYKSSPATIPPYLAQFLQQGNNLFFKPQILLGSTLNSPYVSHESEINEEKDKQGKEMNMSVNAVAVEGNKIEKEKDKIPKDEDDDKIIKDKDNDKINKDDDKLGKETDGIIETIPEIPIENLSVIPPAPILAPLEMPALPQVIVEEPDDIIVAEPQDIIVVEPENAVVEEPDKVLVDETVKPEKEEEPIEKENNIVMPEPPPLMPLNPPKGPLQIFVPKPVPHVPNCIPTVGNLGYAIAIPCFPNYAQPKYSNIVDFENVSRNKDFITPSYPSPRIPLGVTYNRPVETVMPFRENLVSTTRYLPSVKVSKFPLLRTNRRLLKNPHRRLSPIFREKVPLIQEKEVFEEPLSSFSAYCAHNIALQRIVPNIAKNKVIINSVPSLELPERPVY